MVLLIYAELGCLPKFGTIFGVFSLVWASCYPPLVLASPPVSKGYKVVGVFKTRNVRDEQWFLPDTAQLSQPAVVHFLATMSTSVDVSLSVNLMAMLGLFSYYLLALDSDINIPISASPGLLGRYDRRWQRR